MATGDRNHSPPPTYNEAIGEPPPVYSETDTQNIGPTTQNIGNSQNSPRNRVAPTAWSSHPTVVTTQPTSTREITSCTSQTCMTDLNNTEQTKQNGCYCNAYCVACKNKPCSWDGECFCYNCVGFLVYAMTFGLGTVFCACCKAICPETYGNCPSRHTGLNESYMFRDENVCSQFCWLVCGPVCCMTCNETNDVCPLATPCKEHFGMKCVRKMTCYCGGNRLTDCRCSPFDQHACGFIWDCKQVGCKSY